MLKYVILRTDSSNPDLIKPHWYIKSFQNVRERLLYLVEES